MCKDEDTAKELQAEDNKDTLLGARVRSKEMFLKALVIHHFVTRKPGCVRNSKW